MSGSYLTPRSTGPDHSFNWVFLVELLICGILTVFFLFYFNRLFARLVSYGVRTYTWHKYSAYVDVQALQISLLGGRIFFKGLRYHGHNQTILVHSGYITWRYWLRKVRVLDCNSNGESRNSSGSDRPGPDAPNVTSGANLVEEAGVTGSSSLPCRIEASIRGLEWFIYNRSPAYDTVLQAVSKVDAGRNKQDACSGDKSHESDDDAYDRHDPSSYADGSTASDEKLDSTSGIAQGGLPMEEKQETLGSSNNKLDSTMQRMTTEGSDADSTTSGMSQTRNETSYFLSILPLHVDCHVGAIVMGNENTKCILVTKFEKTKGEIDAASSGPLDLYKQLINFRFVHPTVHMKPNPDYKEPLLSGVPTEGDLCDIDLSVLVEKERHLRDQAQNHNIWRRIWIPMQFFRRPVGSLFPRAHKRTTVNQDEQRAGATNDQRWLGLRRYLVETQQEELEGWGSVEYAKFSTVVDCPLVTMSFYWDVAGLVPQISDLEAMSVTENGQNINGSLPPEWGLDLSIHGGIIHYGPWTDRHRSELQTVFFPSPYRDATLAARLAAGQPRVSTSLKIFIQFDEHTTLRIPTREASKDWKWKGNAEESSSIPLRKREKHKKQSEKNKKGAKIAPGPDVRPFGWLDVKILPDSTAKYTLDLVARGDGYHNILNLDLRGTEITSSVNHGLFLRSTRQELFCDLSNPIGWNTQRTWKFDITSNSMELFLLRDHIFLLTDLINDWGSGPSSDYFTFIPFQYLIQLRLPDFQLFLNANDANIINSPADFEDNTYVNIWGHNLTANVVIPLDSYSPVQNEVSFEVEAHYGGLKLHTPPWNTQNTFLDSDNIASLEDLLITGRYNYHTTTLPSLIDTCILDVYATTLSVQLYGFLIRYLMKIKDNYFGDDIHFRTFEEFQQLASSSKDPPKAISSTPSPKRNNDLDVIMIISAEETSAMLPANLYSCQNSVKLDIASLAADLRFTNYYMDLEVNLSPITVTKGTKEERQDDSHTRTQVFVDGVKVHGHRLFGLPPTEPTYVCNWDFSVGRVLGNCTVDFSRTLGSALSAFSSSFNDYENALPLTPVNIIHDITFLRARLESVQIFLDAEELTWLLQLDGLSLNFNDWAGVKFSEQLGLIIPNIIIACVDSRSSLGHKQQQRSSATHAYFQTAIELTMVKRKIHFANEREKQQDYIRDHDERTKRTAFLLNTEAHSNPNNSRIPAGGVDVPTMPFPPMPEPQYIGYSFEDDARSNPSERTVSDMSGRTNSRQSSFLSLDPSSRESLKSVLRTKSDLSRSAASDSKLYEIPQNASGSRAASRDHDGSCFSPGTQIPEGKVPVSGRQMAAGLSPSGVIFTSSFIPPYESSPGAALDLKDVPLLPPILDMVADVELGPVSSPNIMTHYLGEDTLHTCFMVDLTSGVRAYCDTQAVRSLTGMISELHPKDPLDILDSFQLDVMKDISNHEAMNRITRSVVDISLKVPLAHVRFAHMSQEGNLAPAGDQYDLELSRLAVTARSKSGAKDQESSETIKQASTLYVLLPSVAFSARERTGKSLHEHPAIEMNINDLVFWAVSDQNFSAELQFRGLEVVTSSKSVGYLAASIHRATVLGEDTMKTFSTSGTEEQTRLRYLAFSLGMAGSDVADPLFLTRPSYILRSANSHLRANDSWKIVSRFRYIYQSLTQARKNSLFPQMSNGACRYPLDAESRIISSFDQWRGWDLDDLKKSYAIQRLYGSIEGIEGPRKHKVVLVKVSLKVGSITLVVDPGPKQNEVKLEAVSLGVGRSLLEQEQDSLATSSGSNGTIIVIQAHTSKAAVRMKWELCELVETLLKMQNEQISGAVTESLTAETAPTIPTGLQQRYHVVVTADSGVITLDTINLTYVSVSKGMRNSFIFTDRRMDRNGVLASFLLNADLASMELVSHSKVMGMLSFRCPSVYLSFDQQNLDDGTVNSWTIALSNNQFSFELQEEILGLMEVLDSVLVDEVAFINQLVENRPPRKPSRAPRPLEPGQNPINRFDVAVFTESYYLSIALLSTLTYAISGTVARISLRTGQNYELLFDFDLKGHSQRIEAHTKTEVESIAVLELPPMNGRVTSRAGDENTAIEINIAVESISFDAAALHSIFDTLQRPEISSVVQDVNADSSIVKSHMEDIFGSPASPKGSQRSHSTKTFIYAAYITVAGLEVHASAPGALPGHSKADFLFNLGYMQIKATNWSEQHQTSIESPDINIRFHEITLKLSRLAGPATQPCGNIRSAASISCTTKQASGDFIRAYLIKSDALNIYLFAETASTIIDVIHHLQNRLKGIDLSKEVRKLRRLRQRKPRINISDMDSITPRSQSPPTDHKSTILFGSMYSLEVLHVQVCWIVGASTSSSPDRRSEDLVLSFKKIHLATKKENAARLLFEDFQLQMAPTYQNKRERSLNSALLPEVVFNVAYFSTKEDRRFAFQAAGKSLDLRLTSQFVLPASDLQSSIAAAIEKLRSAAANWSATSTKSGNNRKSLLSNKRLASLVVDADFAGAVVFIQGMKVVDHRSSTADIPQGRRMPQHGRYGQFTAEDASSSTTLRSPGLAFKVEYKDDGVLDPALNGEIKVDASTNVVYPTVVPLILEISSSVKEIVQEPSQNEKAPNTKASSQLLQDNALLTADPSAIIGRTKLNLGLRICRQEFSLSCQPMERVAATARFDDIYITMNTVRSIDHGHFFAISAALTRPEASVQHVYSRESTGSVELDSLVLSLMNSRHLSGTSGISAILKISPTKLQVNAKQLQDFLLFREIWIPPEIRRKSAATAPGNPSDPQVYFVQRYQQVAAAGAFPWNATVAIAELDVQLDLGQALGKSVLKIVDFWVSSKKTSDWEQNLCLGFDRIGIESTGRMSGLVDLQHLKVRTSIQWPSREKALNQTPLIQASLHFDEVRVKAAFDYQAFLITDITSFDFLMYNVRNTDGNKGDRLVALLDGDKIQVFGTTQSASQGLALYQAFIRFIEEKKSAYEASLKDIEKYLRRKSTLTPMTARLPVVPTSPHEDVTKTPIALHTDVVVTLKAIDVGAFPGTFFDNQIFKLEALATQATFAVKMEDGRIHSGLGLTLGQFRIALAGVKRLSVPKKLGDVSVDDVIKSATEARGGTILKVPKLVATMQTWQSPRLNQIDFIFKSSFEGKVDVGWNYSRISFIRGMWSNHARTLAHRLGKPLPQQSAVKITGGPQPEEHGKERQPSIGEQEKITAVVNVPQSKYEYTALEPPVIETPQLRDMGEATPPLEWIGLNRERLPNLTHQIVIVGLLEVAKEVEDAYSRILGSS